MIARETFMRRRLRASESERERELAQPLKKALLFRRVIYPLLAFPYQQPLRFHQRQHSRRAKGLSLLRQKKPLGPPGVKFQPLLFAGEAALVDRSSYLFFLPPLLQTSHVLSGYGRGWGVTASVSLQGGQMGGNV